MEAVPLAPGWPASPILPSGPGVPQGPAGPISPLGPGSKDMQIQSSSNGSLSGGLSCKSLILMVVCPLSHLTGGLSSKSLLLLVVCRLRSHLTGSH